MEGVKESEQMQDLKPVESGQDEEAVWVIKKVSVEWVSKGRSKPCGAKQDLRKASTGA